MTPETKTEARERCNACDFPVLFAAHTCQRNADAAALSALRAEHQRTQEQAAVMRAVLLLQVGTIEPSMGPRWVECGYCGASMAFDESRGRLEQEAALKHKPDCALHSDAGRGWVSPEEHQRVVAERDEAQKEAKDISAAWAEQRTESRHEIASLRSQLAEAQRERDEARAERDSARMTRHTTEQLRAALAASEEKAREMREALTKALDALKDHPVCAHRDPCCCYEAREAALALAATALSPSPAPHVGAESEEPKR